MTTTTFVSGTTIASSWLNDVNSATYAGGAAYTPAGTGAVASTMQARLRLEVWAADFGHAVGASAAVNDAALVAAMTAVYTAGGGVVRLAAGVFQHITVPFVWSGSIPVHIKGSGKLATVLQKNGASSSPILNFSCAVAPQTIYSEFSDFSVTGNAWQSPAMRITGLARFSLSRLRLGAATTGLDNIGSLIFSCYDVDVTGNNNGYVSRLGTAYCNNINFFGGSFTFNGNTTLATAAIAGYGLDIGAAGNVNFYGVDVEQNGTHANFTSGDVIIRSTCGAEIAYGEIGFYNGWHEVNDGQGFTIEANANNLTVNIKDTLFHSNLGAGDINCANIAKLVLEGVRSNAIVNLTNSIGMVSIINSLLVAGVSANTSPTTYVNSTIAATTYTYRSVNFSATGPVGAFASSGINPITYSASMTANVALGENFVIVATNNTAFTINSTVSTMGVGQRVTYRISNTSGGALGVATWAAAYKMSAWVQPATGFSRVISFIYDGTNLIEQYRSSADIPN